MQFKLADEYIHNKLQIAPKKHIAENQSQMIPVLSTIPS